MTKYIIEVKKGNEIIKVPFENEELAFKFAAEMSKQFEVDFLTTNV